MIRKGHQSMAFLVCIPDTNRKKYYILEEQK